MLLLNKYTGLYTDHYELVMSQGYFLSSKRNTTAGFDYFFRAAPFRGAFAVFAGLQNMLDLIGKFRFGPEECNFLAERGFNKEFVNYLSSFRFNGNIYAPAEGEIVFPMEPIIHVEGSLIETQLLETLILNTINFETLIATKANRIRTVAGDKAVIDFGMRRAQGMGSIQASRAAIVGGANSTSNVCSAFMYGIPSSGTQAHSWIQSFDDELTSFREFARAFPDKCILLVDTYDTLKQGLPNAITVAKEMEKRGDRLIGVRLDSGDLAYLSKKAREKLDEAGLNYVKIVVSNKLDEHVIRSLREQKAPIDVFGVGTNMITGKDDAALDGVYKMVDCSGKPRLKISNDLEKITLPGKKKVLRFFDNDNKFFADGICLKDEDDCSVIHHPFKPEKYTDITGLRCEELLQPVMVNGQVVMARKSVQEIADHAAKRQSMLPDEHKRLEFPHIYKVGISKMLMELRSSIVTEINEKIVRKKE